MNVQDRLLYHQIHPLKLITDWISGILSCYLLWQHRRGAALLVQLVPPIVVSGALLRWADLERQRQSAFGRYVGRSMTPSMQALRLLGNSVMSLGAWHRRPWLVVLGLLLILFGWLRGTLVGHAETPARRLT
jgi:hypothetical protein